MKTPLETLTPEMRQRLAPLSFQTIIERCALVNDSMADGGASKYLNLRMSLTYVLEWAVMNGHSLDSLRAAVAELEA